MTSMWRLIPPLEASGHVQMAIDRWLLDQHQRGMQGPTLRFYTWSPVAISVGYHQKNWPEHWRSLSYRGQPVEVVKRPSGGRAVLHQGDLTYAVVTSGLQGNRLQVYQLLCEFLIQGWRSLGIELHYGSYQRGYHQAVNCFSLATGADLVLENGSKLIGSAQVYRQGTVLQHGSMRLNPDSDLFAQVFGQDTAELPVKVPDSLQSLSQADLITALCQAAPTCFGMELHTQPLSDSEWEQIRQTA